MRRVIIESPFAGDRDRNTDYAMACLADSLSLGEAPFASHMIYPLVLDDTVPAERRQGMAAGFAWAPVADAIVVYADLGISNGMRQAIDLAKGRGQTIEYRFIMNNRAVDTNS